MAGISKKDKLLEEAQKCAARGQFDKAAKAYEQLVALEPATVNLRQKLAELLVKCGRHDEARRELETVGKNFSKGGFFQKAVAVYRQLQKLYPSDIAITLTLAELNEKTGLVANALTEYKSVYEYHEQAGNIQESLAILERMQNVDPRSIPIQIKRAETLYQRGKADDAYGVFSGAAALLLERNDTATLSGVAARVAQLFPGRDFMRELLTEQVRLGRAAAAIGGIQTLLRSEPHNRQSWELIIQAYRSLNQPERVKFAYQHYLKYFPEEPAAMLGLMAATAAERNLAGTIELLDQYESLLTSSGFCPQLEEIYTQLHTVDPINTRLLEGHLRVATAAGNEETVRTLTSKLQSLHSFSGHTGQTEAEPVNPFTFTETTPEPQPVMESPFHAGADAEVGDEPAAPPADFPFAELQGAEPSPADPAGVDGAQDEEIEIELDFDPVFGSDEDDVEPQPQEHEWLDTVSDLFDAISTSPRGVKFGEDVAHTDAQSHFDLGQAFKEMGLFDEAIGEFRLASTDPLRRVECMIMQCACLRERGEAEKAATMLQALLKSGLSAEEEWGVKYELATCLESIGSGEEALALLNEISAVNPDFRDIRDRISNNGQSGSLDFSDDDLDGFGL